MHYFMGMDRSVLRALTIIVLSLGIFLGFWAIPASAREIIRESHPGYLDSVSEERYQKIEEMVLVPKPYEPERNLKSVIFDKKLTDEFQTKYEQKFGRTEIERNITAPGRFDELQYESGTRVSIEEDRQNRQEFAEYMMRRLAEHHVDNYFKSSPNMRRVYELKERISKLNVEVKKGYKVKIQYSYSGNYVDLKVDNPYDIDSSLRMQMEEGMGPSGVKETILTLGYLVTPRDKLTFYGYAEDMKTMLVLSHSIGPGVSASLTGQTGFKHPKDTADGQQRILLGFTWNQ